MTANIHDSGYKKLFSYHTNFRQLVETFVHEEWVKELDFSVCETVNKSGVGHRFDHRLKPVANMRNPLKRVGRASSVLQRTLAISRRFESAGLAETTTIADKSNVRR